MESMSVDCRVLVENSDASVIIGRGGSNAKTIRDSNGVFLSLLKNDSTLIKERVMVLKGPVESVSNALFHIARLITETTTTKTKADTEHGTVIFRILIHKFLAGAIIGKSGDISKQIQADTGVRMRVSNEPLAGSTEKVVTLTGTPEVIHAASLKILQQLHENPLRANCVSILYKPGASSPGVGAFTGYQPQPTHPAYSQQSPTPSPYSNLALSSGMYSQQYGGGYPDHQQPHYAQAGAHNLHYSAGAYAQGGGQVADKKIEKIFIPTASAGTVIGSRGSIIRDIKTQCGCNISIAAAETNKPDERVVTITGNSNGIQTAIYLIRQRIERPTYSSYLA